MKIKLLTTRRSARTRLFQPTLIALFWASTLILTVQSSHANSAAWSVTPTNDNWNLAANWTPMTIPNGPSDTATFSTSSTTAISLFADTEVNGITFTPGANAYTITNGGLTLTISGLGITNNSGIPQKFVADPTPGGYNQILFLNSATAGNSTLFDIKGRTDTGQVYPGSVHFLDMSSAGSARFTLKGSGIPNNSGGEAYFYDSATLDNSSFTLGGGTAEGASGAYMYCSSSMSTPITGNFVLGGGAVAAASGANLYFLQPSVPDINATFVIGGGADSSAIGAVLAFGPHIDNSIASNFTVRGGAGISAGGGSLGFGPETIDINGSFRVGGGAAASASGGTLQFLPTATNINCTLTVEGGSVGGADGGYAEIRLPGAITGSSNLTVDGGTVSGADGGYVNCYDYDLGSTTYTVNGGRGDGADGGSLWFYDTPGVSGTLIVNGGAMHGAGGAIYIWSNVAGATPRVEVFGNGRFDIGQWSSGTSAVGSIEGTGLIFLGFRNLSTGSNNLSTTFAGVLSDGGISGGSLAPLTKIGSGTLTLSGANTYTGGTTVSDGTLLVSNNMGSGTGTGSVSVTGGTLGGTGLISGAVRVGSNRGSGAFLKPGTTGIGKLTIRRRLELNRRATYTCELDSNTTTTDKAVAKGVDIDSNVRIMLNDIGTASLPLGAVLTVIDNTATTPIGGAFSNLPHGSTFTLGSNNYEVSYTGGTGNDLTLTVVP